uniref:(Fe-S)-binding protein n=1 Tax=Desulfatirhabdium butyrativorans TaxID=340467 RepID=A0A7C4RTU7_9BACT
MAEEPLVLTRREGKSFKDIVMEKLPDGGNLNACLTCGTCAAGCPATGLEGMDPRKVVRMAALGMDEELKKTPWAWMCSMCGRCVHACPMNINIPALVYEARASWPREQRPRGILRSCDEALRNASGSAMGTPEEEFKFVVEDVLAEVREADPRFADMEAPIDKQGAMFFLNQNSREPVTEPEEMVPLWKILHIVGADWTYGSIGWGGENYCMFLADDESWKKVTSQTAKQADDLGCRYYISTECGHVTYSLWEGLQRFNIPHKFELVPIVSLYAKWIREGKLKVNSDWNKNLKVKFTCQDPCNIVRKSYGNVWAEDLRFVCRTLVGDENFIDMVPNRLNNYCCGGGGGALQAPYREERLAYGRFKNDQIVATGASYCITPCHNCHAQIHELGEHYGAGYRTVHLWTLICLSLGILAENERIYLGPDLAEVGL